MSAVHFRIAAEKSTYVWPRTVCGARGQRRFATWPTTLELRLPAEVTCPQCMIIKDWWLENGRPRLTLRRCRALLRPVFGVSP